MRLEEAEKFIRNLHNDQSKNKNNWNSALITKLARECFECILKESSFNRKLDLAKGLSKGLDIYSIKKVSSQFIIIQKEIITFIERAQKNIHPLEIKEIAKLIENFLSIEDCQKIKRISKINKFSPIKDSILKPFSLIMSAYKSLAVSHASNGSVLLSNNIEMLEGFTSIRQAYWLKILTSNTILLKWDTEKTLTKLPKEIFFWRNLNLIYANNQKLTSLPNSIGKITTLTGLHLSNNNLTKLPESIGLIKNLLSLDLSNNPLKSLPQSMSNLENLATLNLKGTRLDEQTREWIKVSLPKCNIDFDNFDSEANKQKCECLVM